MSEMPAQKRPSGSAMVRVHLLCLLVVAAAVAAVESGRVKIPLPGPGDHYVHPTNLALPFLGKPAPLPPAGPLRANTFLQTHALRLFDGRVSGAESVAVRGGVLIMLDKYGQMWEARPADGSNSTAPAYDLGAAPVANLQSNGGGRPLGFHPDEPSGDVYVCDSRRGLVVVEGDGDRRVRDVATRISPASRSRAGERVTYANDLDLATRSRRRAAPVAPAANSASLAPPSADVKQAKKRAEKQAKDKSGDKEQNKGAAGGSGEKGETVVYFTSCTDIDPPYNAQGGFYDTMRGYQLDLAQGAPRGALLAWSPSLGGGGGGGGGGAIVVAEGFHYANGVALSKDGDYALVVETNRNRVLRVWLDGRPGGSGGGGDNGGEKATDAAAAAPPAFREAENSGPGGPGATLAQGFRAAPRVDIFADDLPGIPDGVNSARASRHFGDGEGDAFWVALIGPVPPIARLIGLAGVRAVYAWLPESMRPGVKRWGAALRLRASDGRAEALLLDPTGERVSSVSAVTESEDGLLFLGNLQGDYVSVVSLEAAGAWLRKRR